VVDVAREPRAEAPLFSIDRLGVRYDRLEALRDVTLEVRGGRITAFLGPSGCGKTSFLLALNRMTDLVPGCRVRGSVRFRGEEIVGRGTDVTRLRRRVGMIFQRPNPFPLSIRRNLEIPLREHGVTGRDEIATRIERALGDVGLLAEVKDRLDRPALDLSGGQQQRLCLARALALEPEVLLMDEPCSALDPIASGMVEEHIASLRPRYSILIVTHNLAQARRIADDAAFFWMEDAAGVLVETGPARRVLENPKEERTAAYVLGSRG